MISTQNSGCRGLGSIPGQVIVLVLEQNTLHSLCLLPPRSTNRSVELSGKPDEMLTGGKGWWGNLAMN